MSFQDKLFQAGLINKKQLRKINQEQKIERKQKQGNRKKKQIEAAEKRAKAKAENFIWTKKTSAGWDVTAIKES